MAATKEMFLTAFILIVTIGLASGDCDSVAKQCYATFNQTVNQHPTDKVVICSEIDTFVCCIYKQGCGTLFPKNETEIITGINKWFTQYGVQCSYTAQDLVNKCKNGATSSSVLPSAMVLTVLFFVSLKMRIF
ncbi:uncharacterized protein LOC131928660 [Physella acuta]|uniref:uncharacterized protein LOC131928660 n=1 Tax=Physella acuta TaxID=109671 RepID=UPI0027DD8A38|nr:uncharacterized protein LOC131928660 [Physella acuta]